jgi:hypothetical protein
MGMLDVHPAVFLGVAYRNLRDTENERVRKRLKRKGKREKRRVKPKLK